MKQNVRVGGKVLVIQYSKDAVTADLLHRGSDAASRVDVACRATPKAQGRQIDAKSGGSGDCDGAHGAVRCPKKCAMRSA